MKNKTLCLNRNGIARMMGMLLLFWAGTTVVFGQELAYWNPAGQTGFGVSPYAVSSTVANLTVTGLTRGPGVTTVNTASPDGWGGNGWFDQSPDDYFTWTMAANTGFQQSFTDITWRYRRSSSGPNAGTLYYSIDGGTNVAIGSISFPSTGSGGAEASITLSGVAALQNVPAESVIRFTFFPTGATHAGGTLYVYNGGTNGLRVNGSVTAIPTGCDAPAGLVADNITHASAELSWDAQTGVAGYEYVVDQLPVDPSGAGTATTDTTYDATVLNPSTNYYLHVRTDCGSGNFSPWTTLPFTTLVEPCAAPTGLVGDNITHASADLSWDAQTGVAGYEYVVDQLPADPSGAGTATTDTVYNATGLTASTNYYLHVRTDCGSGNFSPWTTLPFTTLVEPCAAPTGLVGDNITHASADLSWDAQTGVAGYEYVVDHLPADPSSAGTATTDTAYNATGLNPLTNYYLHVRTDCGSGNFSPWTTLPFTTLIEPCDAPAGIAAGNITDESADLSWTAQPGADGYEYAVDQTAADPAGSGTAVPTNAAAVSMLDPTTVYYVHVRTHCGNGNFSPWSTFSFTTISNVGIEEWSADALRLYPSPVTDQLTVQAIGTGTVTLIGLEGKVVQTVELNDTASLDMTTLPAGVYTVCFVQHERVVVRRVIKL